MNPRRGDRAGQGRARGDEGQCRASAKAGAIGAVRRRAVGRRRVVVVWGVVAGIVGGAVLGDLAVGTDMDVRIGQHRGQRRQRYRKPNDEKVSARQLQLAISPGRRWESGGRVSQIRDSFSCVSCLQIAVFAAVATNGRAAGRRRAQVLLFGGLGEPPSLSQVPFGKAFQSAGSLSTLASVAQPCLLVPQSF